MEFFLVKRAEAQRNYTFPVVYSDTGNFGRCRLGPPPYFPDLFGVDDSKLSKLLAELCMDRRLGTAS